MPGFRRAGRFVVLVNSNPATIMTDEEVADAVYLEPLTAVSLEAIIARERPDAMLPTLGGQTGLNLAVDLFESGVIERYGIELLGTPVATIQLAEDRAKFKDAMLAIGEEMIRCVARLPELRAPTPGLRRGSKGPRPDVA